MVMQSFMDGFVQHLLGNLLILAVFGTGTIVCFAAAVRMLVRPGEKDRDHPKYLVLRDDR